MTHHVYPAAQPITSFLENVKKKSVPSQIWWRLGLAVLGLMPR